MRSGKKEREIDALFNLIETTRRDDANRFGATRQHLVTLFSTPDEEKFEDNDSVKRNIHEAPILALISSQIPKERDEMQRRDADLDFVYSHTGELNLPATYKDDELLRSVAGSHIGYAANYLPEDSPPMKNARRDVFKQIAYDIFAHRYIDQSRTLFSQEATEELYREMLVDGGSGKAKQDVVNMFRPDLVSVLNQKIETVFEVGYQRSISYFSERLKKFDQVKSTLKELDLMSPAILRFVVDPDSLLMERSVRNFERPDVEILVLPVKTKQLADFVTSLAHE